jgi:hypothetical protein
VTDFLPLSGPAYCYLELTPQCDNRLIGAADCAPTPAQLKRAVDAVEALRDREAPVALSAQGGTLRSPTLAGRVRPTASC